MKPSIQNEHGQALAHLRAMAQEYSLNQLRVAELFGASSAEMTAWFEDPSRAPADTAKRVAKIGRCLHINSARAWSERVRLSSGMELLFDNTLSVVAISKSARVFDLDDGTGDMEVPEALLIGRHYNDLLPNPGANLLSTGGRGLSDLAKLGFFEGRVSSISYSAEICFGAATIHGIWQAWPVITPDLGIIGHARRHPVFDKRPTLKVPGMRLAWTEIAFAGGAPN
ncbi:MAG TPA: hypothetical protein DCL54_17065 [Alphaproteobacteria bacterium]|nr:hypothetical protein [Alphaproteobacteria bacterium]HAJ48287.1 hypothetical protein [Alphaproteobacteria bacterium]